MELLLEVISEERHLLGENSKKRFQAVGGVIGRHPECDWSIPDQKRHLSSKHAIVSCEDDGFHITDVSTNGVFINGAETPLGRNRTVKLNDADRISMGNIEFVVRLQLEAEQHPFKSQIQPQAGSANPLAVISNKPDQQKLVDPIALFKAANGVEKVGPAVPELAPAPEFSRDEQAVSAPQHRSEAHSAFAPPNMLPEDWLEPVETPNAPKEPAPARPKPGRKAVRVAASKPQSPQAVSPVNNGQQERLVQSFFKGLGVSPEILKKVNGERVMEEMGAVVKANMQGMVALMQQRAQLKNEFRMDMTLVKTQNNNPIKFSADSKQAMKHLFKPESGSFKTMSESFEECYQDMQLHQVALLAGVQAAIREMFDALDPDKVEERVDQDRAGISMSSKPSRCWHKYRSLHDELKSEDDLFNRLFSDAFVSAYDEQISAMKQATKTGEKEQ